jgi:ubiquinone/menaquinone biosynthesis C-methylase UbiE
VSSSKHSELILDQFTRQVDVFSTARSITDEAALRLIVEFSGAGAADTVLDVACGPGLVVCAFARVVQHATGIDITPAMIDRARASAAAQGLANVSWRLGHVLPLPWPDGAFTLVSSRFAFHHFLDPQAVLREMVRVCAPGGTILVVDPAPAAEKVDAYNRMEGLRDPSHARALCLDEHLELFRRAGLPEPRVTRYRLESDLEALMSRSFPEPGDAEKIRALILADLAGGTMDLHVRRDGERVRLGHPIVVLASRRP